MHIIGAVLFMLSLAICAAGPVIDQDTADQQVAILFVECQYGITDGTANGGKFDSCPVEFELCLVAEIPTLPDPPRDADSCASNIKDCVLARGAIKACRVDFEDCLIAEIPEITEGGAEQHSGVRGKFPNVRAIFSNAFNYLLGRSLRIVPGRWQSTRERYSDNERLETVFT